MQTCDGSHMHGAGEAGVLNGGCIAGWFNLLLHSVPKRCYGAKQHTFPTISSCVSARGEGDRVCVSRAGATASVRRRLQPRENALAQLNTATL